MYIEALETSVEIVDRDITYEFYRDIQESDNTTLAMDIETSGLDPKADRIATIQIYSPLAGVEIVRIYEGQEPPTRILTLLESVAYTKIFHYAHFDLGFLMQNYGIFPRNVQDTRVAATIIDPMRERYWNPGRNAYDHGLAALVWTYYGVELDKSIAVSDWFSPLTAAQIEYATRDVIYLPDLLHRLTSEMKPLEREMALSAYQWIPTKTYLKLRNLPDPTGRS